MLGWLSATAIFFPSLYSFDTIFDWKSLPKTDSENNANKVLTICKRFCSDYWSSMIRMIRKLWNAWYGRYSAFLGLSSNEPLNWQSVNRKSNTVLNFLTVRFQVRFHKSLRSTSSNQLVLTPVASNYPDVTVSTCRDTVRLTGSPEHTEQRTPWPTKIKRTVNSPSLNTDRTANA